MGKDSDQHTFTTHQPDEYGLEIRCEEPFFRHECHWPFVPAVGDIIDTRDGLRWRVVGRTVAVDSVLMVAIEIERI